MPKGLAKRTKTRQYNLKDENNKGSKELGRGAFRDSCPISREVKEIGKVSYRRLFVQ